MNIDLNAEEKRYLRKWLAEGNDPADNPWLMAGEDGRPLDYITALREMHDLAEEQMAAH